MAVSQAYITATWRVTEQLITAQKEFIDVMNKFEAAHPGSHLVSTDNTYCYLDRDNQMHTVTFYGATLTPFPSFDTTPEFVEFALKQCGDLYVHKLRMELACGWTD